MLYFILPIKMKWMALVYVVMAAYYFVRGGLMTRVAIGASLLNFVIFFLSSRNTKRFGPRERARKAKFKRQSPTGRSTAARYAGGRSWTIRAWSSVSAPNAMAIMSTARTIFLHMNM